MSAVKLVQLVAVGIAAVAGCSSGAATAPPSRVPPPRTAVAASRRNLASDLFHASRLALVPAGTYGPYVGVRSDATVTAWAADVSGKRRWMTRPLGETGLPLAEAKTIADAATEVDLVAVKPLGGDKAHGFVLLTSSRAFSGVRVDAMAIGPGGELRGGPTPLAESQGDVVWVDAFPTDSGALAMWAVRHGDRASIHGVDVGPSGEPTDEPGVLVTDARTWQIAPVAQGMLIAFVGAGKTPTERGPIRAVFVDTHGHAEKKSVVVNPSATAMPDMDVARIGNRLVFAWSDDRDLEPRLYGSVLDDDGNLVKPAAPLARPFGPQAALRIVPPAAPGGPAFFAWENLIERSPSGRAIRLATLSQDGVLGAETAVVDFASSDGSVPELAATPRGVAAITVAPYCKRGAPCNTPDAVPTFVALDPAMDVVASEPLRLDELGGDVPDLAWGLTCRAMDCITLATGPSSPAPVYTVPLGGLAGKTRPAARRSGTVPPPRASAVEAIGKSETVFDLSASRVGSATLVGWVTYFDPTTPQVKPKTPAPDGKYEPVRAILRLRVVPDDGPRPDVSVLSYRAHSFGGVAIAPGDPTRGDALVAWAAVDGKEPQVFLTLVGADGKKKIQKMLTHTKGGVGDVAVAFAGDGWFVAWVDERTGSSQIYVTKVDYRLHPMMPDRHLGTSASTATGPQLLLRGDHLWVVWSDARGQTPGVADVFITRLATKDLSPVGPEHAVSTTPGHSRSPSIAAFGDGALVAWIEDPPSGTGGAGATLMVARLDAGSEPVAASVTSATLSGSPQGVGLSCDKDACRIAALTTSAEGAELDALVWRGRGELRAARVVGLTGPPKGAVAPFVVGADAFYVDDNSRDSRVRHASITWE